jgi:uracil-DNA glycosylase
MGSVARKIQPGTELDHLIEQIRACRVCVDNPRGKRLPHEPRPVLRASPVAKIFIASQAPGTKVHASGLPFDDASGDRLRNWMGVDRETFYDERKIGIAAMGFCFPGQDTKGGDLPPRKECRATWHDRLFAALPEPELILAVGSYSQDYHLRRLGLADLMGDTLSETLVHWRVIFEARQGPRVMVLPHPSWRNTGFLKKRPWFEKELVPRLRREIEAILRT